MVLYDTRADAATMENHAQREEVRQALANGAGESSRYSNTMLTKMLYYAQRLPDGTVLRLSATRVTWGVLLLSVLQPLLLVLVVALILSGVLAGRVSRRIVEPLNVLDLEHPLENDAYEELSPLLRRIDTIVVSTQHDEFITAEEAGSQDEADRLMLAQIRRDVEEILIPRLLREKVNTPEILQLFEQGGIKYFVNPTGKFVIGGPHGDTGLTGRKIIVDTYGGMGAHGGGAFSGKDPSKVDRSAAYAARHIAKNMVAAGVADEMLVQLSYAIGVAQPLSVFVNTYGRSHVALSDGEIAQRIQRLFDLRPAAIERDLELRHPIYEETASYGHMGRRPRTVVKTFRSMGMPDKKVSVELFTWEKLNKVDMIRKEFGLA